MARALLHPKAKVRTLTHGKERQPVVVIDDMLADPEAWRAMAAIALYERIGPYYPGIRSPVRPDLANTMRDELESVVKDTFDLDPAPPVLECYFSIVTTPPEALAPIQRLPHVDGLEPDRIAILIYLSDAEQGGTAFYRQRATGFETLDQERFPRFEAALRDGVAEHGLPPPAYISGDTELYEQIARYEARPNRALIYRSRALHCAHIPAGVQLSPDPKAGRLTINSFLFDPREP